MCGGVRGVGAGGVVSSAYCLMYKLSTMKITKKQLQSILNHCDSPYIRGVGFMFIRFENGLSDIKCVYNLPPPLIGTRWTQKTSGVGTKTTCTTRR